MQNSFYKDIYELLCKDYPNRKVFLISDHHFFHTNIILYERPQFHNVLEMNEYIIKRHNQTVGEDDIVLFLGDFCFKKNEIKNILSKMNGHKYLVLGNHDSNSLFHSYYDMGFERVFPFPVKFKNDFLSHQPLKEEEIMNTHFKLLVQEFQKSNGINYHGHIHTTNGECFPYLNVCCEAQNYKPFLLGYTKEIYNFHEKPLFINSKEFINALQILKNEKGLEPNFVIADYLYSMMLEVLSVYHHDFYSYGSFPLYKKYNFISLFSDLDIGVIYNEKTSKQKNIEILKQMVNTVYESMLSIDCLHLSYYKRMSSLCIFEAFYINEVGNLYNGCFDANLVAMNMYRDSDFIELSGCSTLEKMLKSKYKDLFSNYTLPKYYSKFLNINGDIANLILQILFQKGYKVRKELALKKLKYVYRIYGILNTENTLELEDVMIRFLFRNILFFHATKRKEELFYMQEPIHDITSFIDNLPVFLKVQMEEIIKNPNSQFNIALKDFSKLSFEEIPDYIRKLVKENEKF